MAKYGEDRHRQRSQIILPTLILAIFLLSGCDKLRQLTHQPETIQKQQGEIIQKQQEEIKTLNKKIYDLEMELSTIQQDVKSKQLHVEQQFTHLDSSLNSLATDYAVIDSNISKYRTCIFDRNSKGFQRVDTDLGQFFISLAEISEQHNTYTLHLNIGNPFTSEIPDFILHVRWGKAFNPSGSVAHDDWIKSLHSKDEHFTEHLKPGRWNKIDISLGPVHAEELQYITIGMEVDNIILTTDIGSHGASTYKPNFLEWRTH
jgi:outer membrane murein-binding lipoprotein Lpp